MDKTFIRTQVYENWDKGEFAKLGATNAPEGSFESLNLVVYSNGFLGPRHGAKNLDVQDVRTDAGGVKGLGWRGTSGADLWWIQDTLVFSIDSRTIGDTADQWATGLDQAPIEDPQFVEYGDRFSYVTNYTDQTYKFDHIAKDLAGLTDSPGGRGIAFYGDRMCVGGTNPDLQRVWISAANDPDDWTDGEFFDVPNQSGAIMALWVQRNHLTIWAQNGEWWVVTGAAGTDSAFLRRVSGGGQHPWNANANRGAALASDDILHIPISLDIPGRFNGATTSVIDYMTINDQDAPDNITENKVLRGMRPDEGVIVFPTTGKFGIYYNGQWTFHKFDTDTIPEITQFWASDEQGQLLFADAGPGSPAPQFYTWTMNAVEHPGFETSALSRAGDDSDAYFDAYVYFPEFWVPEGFECRIRRVLVDFQEWDCGASTPNSYSVTPRSLSRFDNPSYQDGTTLGYSAFPDDWTTGVGSTRRLRLRHLFGVNNAWGGGFQVRITDVGGLAFQSVRVDYEIQPERPGE